MKKIGLKQKVLLVFVGLIIFLLILEIALRIGGLIISNYEKEKYIKNDNSDNSYTILCLGDSTTASMYNNQSTWPEELEKILNNQGSEKKFVVINKGWRGRSSEIIIARLDGYIDQYKPDLIIVMMGGEDYMFDIYGEDNIIKAKDDLKIDLFLEKIKVYKLIKLMIKDYKFNQEEFKNHTYNEKGWTYLETGDLNKSIDMFNKSLSSDPNNYDAYLGLGWVYDEAKMYDAAQNILEKAIEINPENVGAYEKLAVVYETKKRKIKSIEMYLKVTELDPEAIHPYIELGRLYNDIGLTDRAEEMYKKAIEVNPENEWAYISLGSFYENQSEIDKAASMFEKAKEMRLKKYNPTTITSFKMLYEDMSKKGPKLAIMQYPTRNVQELKDMFSNKQQEDIIFIENKDNFEKVITKFNYYEYFVDRAAGVFGHCTLKGNRLIAENVAGEIDKYLSYNQ